MDGLRTARVLVIDDIAKEAEPFLEALAKRSIGSVYYSGKDEDKLPPENCKLTGIRLAALDLDLGVGGEAQQVIGTLFNVLNRLLSEDNGPYLAIVWTSKDEEYFLEFQSQQPNLACPPIAVIKLKKDDYADDIDGLFATVTSSMEQAYPLGLLLLWEQIAHSSSNSVMQVLPSSGGWMEQSKESLRLMLQAAALPDDTATAKLNAVLSVFNSLQLDSVESEMATAVDSNASVLVSPLEDGEVSSSLGLKARLNRRLLCTHPATGVAPGNIYHRDKVCPSRTASFPSIEELLGDMVRSRPHSDEGQRQQQLEREDTKIEELKTAGCIPIAMEVTPLCDYQQNKVGLPRFLCGVALPFDKRSSLTRRLDGFLRTDSAPIGFELGDLTGKKMLVWNSRYIVSVPGVDVNGEAALVRLRQAPLVDIQAWLASQLNRPGYLSLTAS